MIQRAMALSLALGLSLSASVVSAETNKAAQSRARAAAAARPPGPAIPDCPRAAYKGDPVCAGADGSDELPTPSASAVPRERSEAVQVSDDITLTGSDPKDLAKRPVNLNVPNPNPRRQDVGGGAAVNYKF
jgi:hypothetical protein